MLQMNRSKSRLRIVSSSERRMGLLPEAVADKKPQGGRWLLWLPLLIAGVVLYTLNVTNEMDYHGPVPSRFVPVPENIIPNVTRGFLVDTLGCRIPALDPFDPAVRKYVEHPKPIKCQAKGRQLVASNLSSIYVVEDVLPDYNVTSVDELKCCYTPFWRVVGSMQHYSWDVDDHVRLANYCIPFHRDMEIKEEFIKVECRVNDEEIYKDYHAFIIPKPEVEKRCEEAVSTNEVDTEDRPSVLMLGIDAVSRLNFHRQMPHTLHQLRQLGAIEMLGYNKVGDNTFPNLVPVLAGLSEKELRDSCWPKDKSSFDYCSFIWKNFSEAGYRTGFGEDSPWMGMFHYQKVGFVKQPTDYYVRPYIKHAEDKLGNSKHLNAKLCIGSRLTAEVLLEYIRKFVHSLASVPSFALFWGASLTHDFLNYAGLGDDLYVKFLTDMKKWEVLENTVLIVMSDHGIRWGGIRETYQGRMEERQPLLFFVFPAWFRERYTAAVANVQRNTERLTTPFDLHETLADLLHPEELLNQAAIRRRSNEVLSAENPPRGISLFLQLPVDRTCPLAGIDAHWCTCQQSEPVEKDSPLVLRSADFLVKHLNEMLQNFRQCEPLTLAAIQDAQLQVPLQHLHNATKDKGIHDYLLIIRTIPGGGIFEATIRYRAKDDSLSVVGIVSRLNTYGNQSACVAEYHLKLYCFCRS
ncbi:uncharacterized protein [Anabrus simplex]|uniref:uncharacterized protein isoform X3 n=2 Tax=Anabrus simplex TaxID=316456 RepID=UPI0035A2EABA